MISNNLEFSIAMLSQGNPGAMRFLIELFNWTDCTGALAVAATLQSAPSIVGTNLYVLWSDLCDKDLNKVKQLCANCPKDILEDACSRQDYSGRELVSNYFFDSSDK